MSELSIGFFVNFDDLLDLKCFVLMFIFLFFVMSWDFDDMTAPIYDTMMIATMDTQTPL